jgi:hypothetical protein
MSFLNVFEPPHAIHTDQKKVAHRIKVMIDGLAA